ncbi:pyridoxamine 5'-phosphate oxidase family protein [[Empedobacter] haloabium]|uniref:Pyridoxamine 5'-phosphate oxidase family protein n=1 Tax=[Empedobacter] haloabium TaxID=592317 RepID=A0ABZ1UGN2_9BURK
MDGTLPSPWHDGERALQRSVGLEQRMDEVGRKVVRPYMPDQHRDFFAQLPFVVAGSVDAAGDAWATLRAGAPGFLVSPEPRILRIALAAEADDPAQAGIRDGAAVGLLGIELHTRRRNRVNGTLRAVAGGFELDVAESFGNCPQYITVRDWVATPADPAPARELGGLGARERDLIGAAATLFVASYADTAAGRRVDVSHRGGAPGFVQVAADGTLTVPDYPGNRFFNTLGNLLLNGRAGLVFVDFARGDLLQLSGDAQVILDDAALPGAERLWRFTPRRIVWRGGALPLRWVTR